MPKPPRSEELFLEGPAGRLEAVLESPAEGAPQGGTVICHPHPQHGGSLGNKVVHTLARAFQQRGLRTLRFNFRGVGASDGEFDEGCGELDDALAALGEIRARGPDLPVWMAGFSFGAAIAIRVAAAETVAGLVSVAPAVARFGASFNWPPACPWLIVHGDRDEVVPLDGTLDWINSLPPGPELEVFPDTGHFFHGKLVELRQSVDRFVHRTQTVHE